MFGAVLQHPIERRDRKAHWIGIATADVDASVNRLRLRCAGQHEHGVLRAAKSGERRGARQRLARTCARIAARQDDFGVRLARGV
jgi:hypothetical protein